MQEMWVQSLGQEGKVPWRRKQQPTLVFLAGKSHRQRTLVGYPVHRVQKVRRDLVTKQQQQEIANITIPGRQKLSNKYAIYLNLSTCLSTYSSSSVILCLLFKICRNNKKKNDDNINNKLWKIPLDQDSSCI